MNQHQLMLNLVDSAVERARPHGKRRCWLSPQKASAEAVSGDKDASEGAEHWVNEIIPRVIEAIDEEKQRLQQKRCHR
ncbi:MAG: hypothetical protein Q7S05_02005 [bacterium]|nr:hypothetical protein [bacterium]